MADKPTIILKEKIEYINEIYLYKTIMENFNKTVPEKFAFMRYAIPYIILYCIFHESIKNLQLQTSVFYQNYLA